MCHPETDRFDKGDWRDGPLRILGNAHPVAKTALLVAPSGPDWHDRELHRFPASLLSEWFTIATDAVFLDETNLHELDLISFLNMGSAAAQSKRHPHLQVVGFSRQRQMLKGLNTEGAQAEWASAEDEDRGLKTFGEAQVMVPRFPSHTAELWVRLREKSEASSSWGRSLQHVLEAVHIGISQSYNIVIHGHLGLLRILPRGLSERAGLELSCPGTLSSVITASVEETCTLWQEALDRCEQIE